ncbi:MAG TPA: hypothetical protein VIE13_10940 [Terriglobales bacterium]|jgi:hypothetical protein
MGKQIAMSTATSDTPAPGKRAPEVALDCAAFELMLAEHLDRSNLPLSARLHLQACSACAATVVSFETIAAEVRQLSPHALEPGTDLWPQIAAILREEGVIHADGDECRAASSPGPRLVHPAPAARR